MPAMPAGAPGTSRPHSTRTRRGRIASLIDSLRSQLWPVPLLAIILAVIAGQLLPYLDHEVGDDVLPSVSGWLFGGGPEAASNLLQTIAGAMVTVTSLTFSLTVVTLQLASSQFSPRLLRTFTRDRIVHNTLALFLATFAFSLTVLRSVRSPSAGSEGFVPKFAITIAFLLAVASVLALVGFLSHLARQIRVESMLKTVHDDAETTLLRLFPDGEDQQEPPVEASFGKGPGYRPIQSPSSGFLLTVDGAQICSAAVDAQAFVVLEVSPGDSLVHGLPLARAVSASGRALDDDGFSGLTDAVAASVDIGFERTSVQDSSLGLQQVLDIACRALSPGINDATTAVHAIGHVSSLLCGLASRPVGSYLVRDEEGVARVLIRHPDHTELLDLAMRQLLRYAMGDPRAAERTVKMLGELAWVDRTGVLTEALATQRERAAEALRRGPLSGAETGRLLEGLRTGPQGR